MKHHKLSGAEILLMMIDENGSCSSLIEKILGCVNFTLIDVCRWWNDEKSWVANYMSFEFTRFWDAIRETRCCTSYDGEHWKISGRFRKQLEQILRIEILIGD